MAPFHLLVLLGLLQAPTPVAPEELVHVSFNELLLTSGDAAFEPTPRQAVELAHRNLHELTLVEGVVGPAARFDGLDSRYEYNGMPMTREFTAEAWVALSSYPPSWCTIVGQWRDLSGWTLDVGPFGELRFELGTDLGWTTCERKARDPDIATRRWTHVAAVCDGDTLRLYVDGEERAHARIDGEPRLAAGWPLRLGSPPQWWWYTHPVGEGSPGPSVQPGYALDGILDEVVVHSRPLTPAELRQRVAALRPSTPPALPQWHLPRGGPPGRGRFGATPCRLAYEPSWDARRPDDPCPDLVVRFDSTASRIVFWAGLAHAPLWVTGENVCVLGSDMACDVRTAAGRSLIAGILQRPDDPCSRIRVLTSHAARIVLHRHYEVAQPAPAPGVGPSVPFLVDELITLYPDACGTRDIAWPVDPPSKGWSLVDWGALTLQALLDPGQVPADVVGADYLTLAEENGEIVDVRFGGEHSEWNRVGESNRPPGVVADPTVVRLNVVSDDKPFLVVLQPGPLFLNEPHLSELRSRPSSFAQVLSEWGSGPGWSIDGSTRPVAVPGDVRLGAILAQAGEPTKVLALVGMRPEGMDDLLALARGWAHPPELTVTRGPWRCAGWDRAQRAWRLGHVQGDETPDVALRIEASDEHPLVRPALVLHGWGEREVSLAIDGEPAQEGVRFRQGLEPQLGPSDLVLWLDLVATSPVELVLTPRG